jgi:hypothetical protein
MIIVMMLLDAYTDQKKMVMALKIMMPFSMLKLL